MKRWLAALLVGVVFVLGIAAGSLGTMLALRQRWVGGGGGGARAEAALGERLRRRLDLSPEQSERVEAILRESHAESRLLRERIAPEIRAQMERSWQRIDEILTPEQRKRFAAMREEQRNRAERFLFGGPGRGGRRWPRATEPRDPEPPSSEDPPGGPL